MLHFYPPERNLHQSDNLTESHSNTVTAPGANSAYATYVLERWIIRHKGCPERGP